MTTHSAMQKNNVVIRGNPDAQQTIIFGHGFGTDQSTWDEVTGPFLSNYRVVLYDLTGSGKSDPEAYSPNKYDSLETHAEDLVAICESTGTKGAIMVGHSVSGMISLLAALKSPELFSKMIFVGSSPRYINDEGYYGGFTQQALDELYNTMQNNYHAWISGFAPYVMQNEDRPELAAMFARTLSAVRPDIALNVVRTIFQSDYRHKLKLLGKPTLLVHCKNDPAVPLSVAEYMHEHIPHNTCQVLDATGHFPQMSAPAQVIKAIQGFIAA